jgi:hypothetical protein
LPADQTILHPGQHENRKSIVYSKSGGEHYTRYDCVNTGYPTHLYAVKLRSACKIEKGTLHEAEWGCTMTDNRLLYFA